MSSKLPTYFSLSQKEETAMKVLWNTEEPLSASEIAKRIPNRAWPAASIQNILRGLEQKGAIRIDAIVKLGKGYGRLFRPALSANEYAAMQFERYYQSTEGSCLPMMSFLLGNTTSTNEEIIDALHTLLDSYEKRGK